MPQWRSAVRAAVFAVVLPALAASALPAQAPHGAVSSLPLTFEQNRGLADAKYAFILHRDGVSAAFLLNGIDFLLPGSQNIGQGVHLRLIGGDAPPIGKDLLAGRSNYLLGADSSRWVHGVPNYRAVEYKQIYPGISLDFYGNGGQLEHDFQVEPGADPSRIAFRLEGAESVALTPDGNLAIHLGSGELTLRKPVAYQDMGSERKAVDANFLLAEDGVVSFRLGAYAHDAPLVIDPVFVFSTYLAGAGYGSISAVTTDAEGNVYVTGATASANFPLQNPLQPQLNSTQNAFVTKLDSTGTNLIYSTYLGGTGTDYGSAVAVDAKGDAIVAGVAVSSDFPHAGLIQSPDCGYTSSCYFLASLSPDGSQFNYAGEVGGSDARLEANYGELALDGAGNAYLAGDTTSPTFPITSGTLSPTVPDTVWGTLFVMKVDPAGKLIYSTIVPGIAAQSYDEFNNAFVPTGLSIDSSGQATVAGWGGPGLPVTAGVVQSTFSSKGGPAAGFVLQIDSTASAINFASYLPGTDQVGGMAVDPVGNMYFVGATAETTLPTTATAYEKTADSGFVMELNPGATAVKAATYFKCCLDSDPYGFSTPMRIALDSIGNVFVAGNTYSSSFPMKNPFTPIFGSDILSKDMAIGELDPSLHSLLFGSYLSSTDALFPGSLIGGMTVGKDDALIVAGRTTAFDFPTTPESYQPVIYSPVDPLTLSTFPLSFVAKINPATPAASACLDKYSLSYDGAFGGYSVSKTVTLTNCGNAPLHVGSVTTPFPGFTLSRSCGAVAVGAACAINVAFSPLSGFDFRGSVSIKDDASSLQQKVTVSGSGHVPIVTPPATPVDLGHLTVGTSATSALEIGNRGLAPMAISGVTVTSSSFAVSSYKCFSMPYGGGCTLQVVFKPHAAGTLAGSLVIANNDPVNPHLVIDVVGYGDSANVAPAIDELSPAIGLIKNGPIAVQIFGGNFYPSSVVKVNGASIKSTYVSNAEIDITLAAPTSIGQIPITVVNPSPGGGTATASFAPYLVVNSQPTALVAVPTRDLLYAASPSGAYLYPNTVLPITASTGATGTPIPVGKDPSLLAASADGKYVYVANAGSQTVQRINMVTQTVERTFPYAVNYAATDLQVVPGAPLEVLLAQGGVLTLFNDTGLVNSVNGDFDNITFAGDPVTIYGMNARGYASTLTAVNLTSSGLQLPGISFGDVYAGSTVGSDGTLLYTNIGQVWDPAGQSQVGKFPLNQSFDMESYAWLHNLVVDTSSGMIFGSNYPNTDVTPLSGEIEAFNLHSLQSTGTLLFPDMYYVNISDLARWGSDGLAFIASSLLAPQGVYLIRSNLVTRQATNPVPILRSIAPASIDAGTTNYSPVLKVNGSGLTLGSVICWNGAALKTNYVSGTQVITKLNDALFATAGTAQVTVVNPTPGGGTSNALSFDIFDYNGTSTATPSASALDFGSVQVGGSSSVQYVTLTDTGHASVTFSSISASGDFSVQSTCLTNLTSLTTWSPCQIAVTFKPAASGLRTGAVTIVDNATNSPQIIQLSGTGLAQSTRLALSASASTATYGKPVTLTATLSSGSAASPATNGELVTFLNGSVSLGTSALAGGKASFTVPTLPVGSYNFTASFAGDGNYGASASSALKFSVTQAPQTITLSLQAANATYGSAPIALSASATSGLPVSFTASGPGTLSGSSITITGAGSVVIKATQAGNSNYSAAPAVTQTLTVAKATLTLTANNASVFYNQALPKLTYTAAGFLNSDTASVLTGSPTETTTAKQGSAVGAYPITLAKGTLAATNYGFSFQSGTLTVTSLGTAASPAFQPAAGTYTSVQKVTLSCPTAGAAIYYTLNGSAPTGSSTKYSGVLTVSQSAAISAIAVAPGYTQSAPATAAYTINLPAAATPVFKPVAGTYDSAQTVTITSATNGAAIYYTTNGTMPTTASTKYSAAIKVSASETLTAIAVATGYSNSPSTSAAYTIATVPAVLTQAATGQSSTGATLSGTVTANNATTQYWFAYGSSKSALTNSTSKTGALTGATATSVSAAITGLKAKTAYYFQIVAANAVGTSPGAVLSFTTN